jgi:hypothetical protein
MTKVTWTMAIGGRKNDIYGQQLDELRIKMQIWIVINVLRYLQVTATACSVQFVDLVPPEEHGAHPAARPSGK